MALTSFINEEHFVRTLREHLSKEMIEAAEPVIKEAMAQAEREMRKRLGSMVVGLLATHYNVMRDGRDLLIRVQMEAKPGGLG
jgi:glutamate racemase